MKYILFLILYFFCIVTYAQTDNPWFFEDYYFPPEEEKSASTTKYTPHGEAFTPKGDMRILVVCAGFGSPYDSYECGSWNTGSTALPDWADDKSTFYNQNSDFTTYSYMNNNQNISRFYYEMSKESFRLVADVYPTRININPSGATNWGDMTRKVFEKMKADDPNFNWSVYDNRENYPDYEFDSSNSQSDNIPDYVIVLFRYNPGWSNQPISGMKYWPGSYGGYSILHGLDGFNYNGYTFHSSGGYTHCSGVSSMYGLFIHEVAHSVFNCPHYAYANSIVGKYFYGQVGWGMMSLGFGAFGSALGWERWYLDWIDLESNGVNSDIEDEGDLPTNGEFILRDFITTGDVIRIKIPNGTGKNQYLWLENHIGTSIFDDRGWTNDGCSNPLPSSPEGLVAYIESINDDKGVQDIIVIGANAIKYIHPNGNSDYSFGSSSSPCNLWGNLIYDLTEGQENPISGQNRAELIRSDLNNNNEIYVHEHYNSTSPKNEQHWVTKRDGNYTYDFIGYEINFEIGQKLGMATNPALTNRPIYDKSNNQLSPFYLNGISVSILQEYSNGNIKIKVEYNDVDIEDDIRWAGTIYLPDITGNSNADVNILTGNTLLIDKSQTANRHTKVNGEFINPTEFYCQDNSLFKLNSSSTLIIDNESSFVLESGSELEVNDGAVVYIKAGAEFEVRNGATVTVKGDGKIIVECNGVFCVQSGASINLQDENSFINFLSGHVIGTGCLSSFSGVLSGNGSINVFSNNVLSNLTISSDSYYFGTEISASNITITGSGTDVIFDISDNVTIPSNFEVQSGTTFKVEVNENSCN